MIPKKIHYCWFGGKPLPELALLCIESWRKFLPNYEIIRWDESNYDVNKIPYISEAYKAQKFAFVSDYARFDILYKQGGLYFDTDVEVIKDMSPIVSEGAFMGCEKNASGYHIASGLGLGAESGMAIFEEILENYNEKHFRQEDGSFDFTTVVEIITVIFNKYGFVCSKNEIQKIKDVTIYPPEYFCPRNGWFNQYQLGENTYSIHHYAASWMSAGGKFRARLSKMIGYENYNKLKHLVRK